LNIEPIVNFYTCGGAVKVEVTTAASSRRQRVAVQRAGGRNIRGATAKDAEDSRVGYARLFFRRGGERAAGGATGGGGAGRRAAWAKNVTVESVINFLTRRDGR